MGVQLWCAGVGLLTVDVINTFWLIQCRYHLQLPRYSNKRCSLYEQLKPKISFCQPMAGIRQIHFVTEITFPKECFGNQTHLCLCQAVICAGSITENI